MTAPDRDFDQLAAWCLKHDLVVSPEHRELLRNYLRLLRLWARRVSLVGVAELPLMERKHLPDCLFAAAHCPQTGSAADLGSGAGLPGIPIAIMRPGLQVDLIESRAKKASFLAEASGPLANARPRLERIERLGRTYDVAIARALAPLDRLLPLARPTVSPGGYLLAMKSTSFDDELATVNPADTGFSLADTLAYKVPSGEERYLLKFEAI